MKTKNDIFYSVAPLTKNDCQGIINKLRASKDFPIPSGIPTYRICREVGLTFQSKNNLCWDREDRYRPCTTLCYVVINILHMLVVQDKKW
jgi:hypothetical protein